MKMQVSVYGEDGYDFAMLGITLSKGATLERAKEIAPKLAWGIPGERSFLELIHVKLDVTAPRYWWQEADRYRISAKMSQSTMHTLVKSKLTFLDFEYPIQEVILEQLNFILTKYKEADNPTDRKWLFIQLKNILPEGFLQRRVWKMPYNTLQNIYTQRHDHKLDEWKYFCSEILSHIEHPEFIVKEYHGN